MSTGRKRIIAGALALAAVLVVGCGSSSDDTSRRRASTPGDAVQAFYDTSKAEDGAGACATLSAASQDIAAAGADSCEAAFDAAVKAGEAGVPDKLEIGDVKVDGDTATVAVTADGQKSSFTLVNEDGVEDRPDQRRRQQHDRQLDRHRLDRPATSESLAGAHGTLTHVTGGLPPLSGNLPLRCRASSGRDPARRYLNSVAMAFPATRMRRLRRTGVLRGLTRETELTAAHLIQPLFVKAGTDVREDIDSMPGVQRLSISELVEEAGAVRRPGSTRCCSSASPPTRTRWAPAPSTTRASCRWRSGRSRRRIRS